MTLAPGFSEVGTNLRVHVKRVKRFSVPPHAAPCPRIRRGPEAEKAVDSPLSTPILMKVWTAVGFPAVPGTAVIVGPLPLTSMSQTSWDLRSGAVCKSIRTHFKEEYVTGARIDLVK